MSNFQFYVFTRTGLIKLPLSSRKFYSGLDSKTQGRDWTEQTRVQKVASCSPTLVNMFFFKL